MHNAITRYTNRKYFKDSDYQMEYNYSGRVRRFYLIEKDTEKEITCLLKIEKAADPVCCGMVIADNLEIRLNTDIISEELSHDIIMCILGGNKGLVGMLSLMVVNTDEQEEENKFFKKTGWNHQKHGNLNIWVYNFYKGMDKSV